jgi:Ni,Fe-hydrogenase III large subunit
MWIAEKISGNRKTYALCLIGGVRWDITEEINQELRGVMDKLEISWKEVVKAVEKDSNIQKRTRGVGIADRKLVKESALLGPVARAAGVPNDTRLTNLSSV